MLAEMAQSHYNSVQGSFVILVKFRKQDLVLVQESGAEVRAATQSEHVQKQNQEITVTERFRKTSMFLSYHSIVMKPLKGPRSSRIEIPCC